eukprot:4721686-Amphidinium_carterae.1
MATDGRAEFTPSRIQQVQDHLQMKLVWLCREKRVGFANVYNIDASMVHLVPSPEKGWTFSKRP